MTLIRRTLLQSLSASAVLATVPKAARAQAYPSRAVRVIVTTGPGGQGDTTARLIATRLSETLGQSFYVENMPGAGGNIAMAAAARAQPDGYTILAATGNLVTNISLYPKIPYDPYKDFEPVSLLCSSPHILVVHPSVAANSVNELVALAKANPGKFSYSSAGRGTPAHLAGEMFKSMFQVDITHVPFNGGGPATASTLGGHVPIAVSALPTAITYVRGGNLRALALMGSRRSQALPDVPTMKEASGHDLPADIVTGFMLPAGTPAPVVEKLSVSLGKALTHPTVRERFGGMGVEIMDLGQAEFAAYVRADYDKWQRVAREGNIVVE